MSEKTYDLISMGRSSIDLYSADVGAPFVDITKFDAFVGGCPTNVAVATARQGLRTALVTGLGVDPVGDFLEKFLHKEGVDMNFSPRKPGKRTSAVVLGIEPPDRFPLVYYREGCADIDLNIDDVQAVPAEHIRESTEQLASRKDSKRVGGCWQKSVDDGQLLADVEGGRCNAPERHVGRSTRRPLGHIDRHKQLG